MNDAQLGRKSFRFALLTSVLLASAPMLGAQALNSDATPVDTRAPQQDGGELSWNDIRQAHGPELEQRGWDEEFVLDSFDHDGDGRLNKEEHRDLVVSMEVGDPEGRATAVGAEGAADSHINRGVPDVVSNPQEEVNTSQPESSPRDSAEDDSDD